MKEELVSKRFTVDIDCEPDMGSAAIEMAIERGIRDYKWKDVYVQEE
jgi:hypothetical protein